MWAKVNAQSVAQENTVNLMQIDMLQLNVLQTQLDNLSMQATLIIGFALGMWAGETLDPLLDDKGTHCIFKTDLSMMISLIFFACVALCICSCFVCVTLASYVKQASQAAALLVCTGAAVANTRVHLEVINFYFIQAIACFVASAGLLIWLFVGLPARIDYTPPVLTPSEEAEGLPEDESITRLYDGEYKIACIDIYSSSANRVRDMHALSIAWTNTAILGGMCIWGFLKFRKVRQSFVPETLMIWYTSHKAEVRAAHEALRRARHEKHKPTARGRNTADHDRFLAVSTLLPPIPAGAPTEEDSYYYAHGSDTDST